MSLLFGVVALAALLLASYLFARISRPRGWVEVGLLVFLYAAAQVLVIGYTLSAFGLLASLGHWCAGNFALLAVAVGLAARVGLSPVPALPMWAKLRASVGRLPLFQRIVLFALGGTSAALGLVNLGLVLFVAPANWDSMTYHLARMAYYLQQGSLDFYDASYWAQVVHPKGSTLFFTYAYLVAQRNENLIQLVQYAAYWVSALVVYGIARRCGYRRSSSLAAALVFSLLTESLMLATTTQNDLLLTAFVGIAAYFLLAYRESGMRRNLWHVSLALAIAVGIKSSMSLALPSLAILGLYAILTGKRPRHIAIVRDVPALVFAGAICSALFVLPSGYMDNYRLFGHPVGPPEVRESHSFEGHPAAYAITQGGKNLLRYGVEFVSFDGIPPLSQVVQAQSALRAPLRKLDGVLGLRLEDTEATRSPFAYDQWPYAHEDWSYWGILGFGLVWIAVLVSLVGLTRSPTSRVLALAALVFFVAQAFGGPYDPWRGRYFLMAAPLAVPCVAVLFETPTRRGLHAYLTAVVILGCISAASAVLLRTNGPLLSVMGQPSVVVMDRIGQLTRSRPEFAETFRRFDEMVPPNAVVALALSGEAYEYPLFGQGLTRRLIPVNGFRAGYKTPPSEACYLLFELGPSLKPAAGDVSLGNEWYLRSLK